MPSVLQKDGFRFYFYSSEGSEPAHVHVVKDSAEGKVWLEPQVKIAYIHGFTVGEIRQINDLVHAHAVTMKNKWYEYFGK